MFIVFKLFQMLMWLCWWLEIAEQGNNKALIYWPIHSKLNQGRTCGWTWYYYKPLFYYAL